MLRRVGRPVRRPRLQLLALGMKNARSMDKSGAGAALDPGRTISVIECPHCLDIVRQGPATGARTGCSARSRIATGSTIRASPSPGGAARASNQRVSRRARSVPR